MDKTQDEDEIFTPGMALVSEHYLDLENPETNSKPPSPAPDEPAIIFPLLQPPVIRNLFKYLRLKDLVAARSVCTTWGELATAIVKSRIDEFTIDFIPSSVNGENVKPKSMTSYSEMITGSDLKFTSFQFNGLDSLNSKTHHNALLDTFSETTVKKLIVQNYHECDDLFTPTAFRDILLNKAPFLEELVLRGLTNQLLSEDGFYTDRNEIIELNLRSLTVFVYNRSNPNYNVLLHPFTFIKHLLKASTKLEELVIRTEFDGGEEEEEILFLLYTYFMESCRPEFLKKLDIKLLDENTIRLFSPGLSSAPLEVFRAREVDFVGSNTEFEIFLQAHQDTLKELQLNFLYFHDTVPVVPIPLQFPVMKNLKILYLGFEVQTFVEIDYGKMFPALVVLKIAEEEVPDQTVYRKQIVDALFPESSSPCLSVTDLELPLKLESALFLQNIARIFPNVRKLNLAAQRGKVLEAVWDCWPNLEKLALSLTFESPRRPQYYHRNLDSIFTGFTKAVVDQWNKKLQNGTQLKCDELEAFRRKPSITRLKSLKYLVLHIGSHLVENLGDLNPKDVLTDVTLLSTFALMKNLHCFMVESNAHKFSNDAMQTFTKELELKETRTSTCSTFVKYSWQGVKEYPHLYSDWQTI